MSVWGRLATMASPTARGFLGASGCSTCPLTHVAGVRGGPCSRAHAAHLALEAPEQGHGIVALVVAVLWLVGSCHQDRHRCIGEGLGYGLFEQQLQLSVGAPCRAAGRTCRVLKSAHARPHSRSAQPAHTPLDAVSAVAAGAAVVRLFSTVLAPTRTLCVSSRLFPIHMVNLVAHLRWLTQVQLASHPTG